MADAAKGSLKLTNQETVTLDTTLTNADNSVSVPVQFRISDAAGECGIYRVSDGKQLWGGRVVSDGRAVTVTNALMDPDATGEAYIDMETTYDSENHTSNWIPRYGKNDGTAKPQYEPDYDYDLWQHTSRGKVPGISDTTIDLNLIHADGKHKTIAWFRGEE